MAAKNDLLKKKAFGISEAIEKMTSKERGELPSPEFGEDYNRLRNMVLENNKELEEYLPPQVKIEEYMYGERKTSQTFAEINSYCSQIYQLL